MSDNSEREPHFKEVAPNGICEKGCTYPDGSPVIKISRENVKICPNCDIPQGTSQHTNTIKDPGHDKMQSIIQSKNPKDLPEPEFIKHPGVIEVQKTYEKLANRPFTSLNDILISINSLPMPSDMKAIKKLLKVKQLLEELSNGK